MDQLMYDIAKIMLGVIVFVLGAFMCFCPKLMMKEKEREIEHAVRETKKRGILLMVVGIVLAVVMAVLSFVMAK